MKQNLSIKDWSIEDRPREKMQLKGANALSDAELLAILIGTGTKNESAVDIAKRILKESDNNLMDLGTLSVFDFQKVKGIGAVKAITLFAAFELGRRRNLCEAKKISNITSSKDIFLQLQPKMAELQHEEFHVLFLNRNNTIIADKILSTGGVAGTVIDVKLIGKTALENLASSIILSHNHPSGNKQPSVADIEITKKIKQAAPYFDCTVLDHIIIAKHEYYSFADEGIL